MTAAMVAEVRRRFGVPVVVRYTSTESSLGTGTTLTSSDEEVATTVGRPVAGVELAIVDDAASPVPPGQSAASACARPPPCAATGAAARAAGARVADLVDAAATAAVLAPDGWLTTGDFGRLTPEGNLQLSGRAHERYIRGGYNVYPAEVEEALVVAPRRRPGRRGRRGRRGPRRGRRGGRRGRSRQRARPGLAARPLRPRALRLQGARRPGAWSTSFR